MQGGCTESPTKPKGRPRKDGFSTSATCSADTTCQELESHDQDSEGEDGDETLLVKENYEVDVESVNVPTIATKYMNNDLKLCATSENCTKTQHMFPE